MMKNLIFFVIFCLFITSSVSAQINMTPESKEEAENIAKDFLLDFPITENMAFEIAKNITGSDSGPESFSLEKFIDSGNGETRLVWNISFKDKIVLIDAINGEVVNVKTKKRLTPLTIVGNPFFIIFCVLIFSFVAIYVFKVMMDKYFKKEQIPQFYKEES